MDPLESFQRHSAAINVLVIVLFSMPWSRTGERQRYCNLLKLIGPVLEVEGEHEERAIALWQYVVVVNLLTHLRLPQLEA